VSKRLQEDAPALLETLPLLPDLILNKLRQSPQTTSSPQRDTPWLLPLVATGALALGLGIAEPVSSVWVVFGAVCLLTALFTRKE